MRIKLILISTLLASCSYLSVPLLSPYKMDVRQGNYITAEMREKLKLGMTKQQVRYVLGTPMISDVLHANRWDYPFRLEQQGKLVDKQLLSLYFDGNNLSKIDDGKSVEAVPAKPVLAAEPATPVVAAVPPAVAPAPTVAPAPVVAPAPAVAPSPVVAPAPVVTPIITPAPLIAEVVASAVAPAPAPSVVAKSKPALNPDGEAEVLKAVQGWATAWQARNASAYLSAYTKDFKSEGLSHAAWEKQRNSRVVKAIEVALSDINVSMVDATHAKVSFTQRYRAEGYHDQVEKSLQLVKQADAWLIVEERVIKAVKSKSAKYVPATVEAQAAGLSEGQQAVKDAVNRWADAWSARDAEKYLASYSAEFKPKGSSKAEWDEQRKSRIGKARSIVVELSEFKIKLHDDSHASVTFIQAYRSDTYQDSLRKTLLMEKVADDWLIQAEQVAK